MARYWDEEQPLVVSTAKNVLRYYQKSGKLQISAPNWISDSGEEKQGKTVTLDITALKGSPEALDIVKRAVNK